MQVSSIAVLARSQLVALKTLLLLLVAMLILSWLNQSSISLYCQQKYHSRCELPILMDSSLWRLGGDLTGALGNAQASFVSSFESSATAQVPTLPVIEVAFAEPLVSPPVAASPVFVPPIESVHAALPPPLPAAVSVTSVSVPAVAPASQAARPKPLQGQLSVVTLQAGDEVFFVGDSLMQGVAPYLANTLFKRFNIKSVNLSRQSTGLAYPGFFNWPLTVQSTLQSHRNIRLVVIFLGPNDPWDMPDGRGKPFLRFKSPAWESAYRQRVQTIFEQARRHDAQVIWVGPPNMNAPRLSAAMQYLRELYKSEAQQYRQIYLSANDIFGYQADEFSFYSIESTGKKNKVRADDGIHFTTLGQKLIAAKVLTLIKVHNLDFSEH
ncbi:SGNH/GDSL hydrolase family protein [Pseudomonas mohnii]|uniref:SGNH/GDSL hydrolase family protein n=1 Tax=Pseudomonas mohnii TaxID=395600 RepID=UPI0018C5D012|nr:SGNH family hydrolase [Pseudomonas mohnii]MBH8611146.1 DUF459 domain-containing protein [Pseudomonas mohnii]